MKNNNFKENKEETQYKMMMIKKNEKNYSFTRRDKVKVNIIQVQELLLLFFYSQIFLPGIQNKKKFLKVIVLKMNGEVWCVDNVRKRNE